MTQLIFAPTPDVAPLELPDPEVSLMPGVLWGDCAALFTPAFWRALLYGLEAPPNVKLGTSLVEEAGACLLGGHGIPSEVGNAAFYRLRDAGLFNGPSDQEAIARRLAEPLTVYGRQVRYRFVKQKSRYLAAMLRAFAERTPPEAPLHLREWLTEIPGFGPKTASWVVRNYCDSDDVAILDVHIIRAGQLVGLFEQPVNLSKDYNKLEQRFLCFAHALGVRASWLDAVIWEQMKVAGALGRATHGERLTPR